MCPSYRVTKDETHLTRGRANTLRLAITGQLGPDAFGSDAMRKTMDLCVSCKGCKRECPVGVENAKMGWGSDVVAEVIRRLDIPFIAMVPGASYRGFQDSLVNYLGNRDPQMLVCLHEEHCVAIAHGYAKVTDKPMAAAVHSNVGLMHATMAVFDAWCDRAPVMVLGATGPVDAAMRRPWIDWIHTSRDQAALVRDYVTVSYTHLTLPTKRIV